YADVFGMESFHRDPDGSCFVTDGYLTLALLKHHLDGEAPIGMNHFGFHVADVDPIFAKLANYGLPRPGLRATKRPFAEHRAVAPEGNWFDLPAHGYGPGAD